MSNPENEPPAIDNWSDEPESPKEESNAWKTKDRPRERGRFKGGRGRGRGRDGFRDGGRDENRGGESRGRGGYGNPCRP
ncbi:DEAD-box ATP-dependent RNA helicase CshA-like [Artemia franciscana]